MGAAESGLARGHVARYSPHHSVDLLTDLILHHSVSTLGGRLEAHQVPSAPRLSILDFRVRRAALAVRAASPASRRLLFWLRDSHGLDEPQPQLITQRLQPAYHLRKRMHSPNYPLHRST